MDALDFMERESAETLRELMRDYTASFERVAKVATALVGGAAALVAYAPTAAVPLGMRWVLLGVAGVWALAAGGLVVWGARSNHLQSGASVRAMQDRYIQSGGALSPYDGNHAQALVQLRLAELNRRHCAAEAYALALTKRARALNRAIACAAAAPALGAALAGLLLLSGS